MTHSTTDIESLFQLPFNDLILEAQTVHRQHFNANEVQVSTLLSIKTGGCSEDCGYCSQSARNDTGLESGGLMSLDEVVEAATAARAKGASRFCMGAAWRNPRGRNFERVLEMVERVREEGLETCMTLGMLDEEQTRRLKQSGLDYYNHNLDTSPEFYGEIISTRTYEDRLNTIRRVRKSMTR